MSPLGSNDRHKGVCVTGVLAPGVHIERSGLIRCRGGFAALRFAALLRPRRVQRTRPRRSALPETANRSRITTLNNLNHTASRSLPVGAANGAVDGQPERTARVVVACGSRPDLAWIEQRGVARTVAGLLDDLSSDSPEVEHALLAFPGSLVARRLTAPWGRRRLGLGFRFGPGFRFFRGPSRHPRRRGSAATSTIRDRARYPAPPRAVNSVVECDLHTVEVTGSNPVRPTRSARA